MTADITITGTWLPSDPDTGSHRLLPFDVPAGTGRIEVRYRVEALGSTPRPSLDIGLFDPGGTGFLDPRGFRGWTGAFRSEFFVSPTEATPGYLRGLITPGTWHVLAGVELAAVAPDGMRYTIEIALTPGDGQSPRPYPVYDPGVALARQGWYRGNLHSHTYYSDGNDSIEAMAAEHLRLGLHFGALTEHNILNPDLASGHRPGFIWLPSEEVTTYKGHLNAWGVSRWLDFRCSDETEMRFVIDAARAQGAVTSINHPKDDGPPWDFAAFDADCMEVWQAPWFLGNFQSLALWDRLLREGRQIVAVGGSDLHRIGTPERPYAYSLDNPTTWVRAPELSIAGILEGISRGHVFISRDAHGPQVYLSAAGGHAPAIGGDSVQVAPGGELTVRADVNGGLNAGQDRLLLRLVTQEGVVHEAPVLSDDFRAEYLWTEAGAQAARGPAYIRAELIRDPGPDVDLVEEPSALWMEAMSNPVYVVPEVEASTAAASAKVELAVARPART
jgi:hypothetical protein